MPGIENKILFKITTMEDEYLYPGKIVKILRENSDAFNSPINFKNR